MGMRRLVPLGLVAGAVALATMTAAGAASPRALGAGPLRDLQPASAQPTDGATAQVVAIESGGSTTVRLQVQGLDRGRAAEGGPGGDAGLVLGAHVHVGPCVAGEGAAAGPHYNADPSVPPVVTDQTEVWLDIEVGANGTARAEATVPFTIPAGAASSVVIHALPTSTGPVPPPGAAGARWACLPVEF